MRKHAISFAGVDKVTRDSFAEECDVNHIVALYQRTGTINHLPRTAPQYGDAPDISFHEAACIRASVATAEAEGWTPTRDEIVDSAASKAVSDDPKPPAGPPEDAAPGESGGD